MLIPENILQTQLCSECRRYLTVPPIKVYPNRHVKCGRCVQNSDNGVVSLLYQMVVKDFEYPCVNRFEGCTQILNYDEVKEHEEKCIANEQECPLCNDFNGTAYYLQLHLRQTHLSHELCTEEDVLLLNNGSVNRISWYCKGNLLLILFCDYDSLEKKLSLNIHHIMGEQNPASIEGKFLLFSEKQLKLKSEKQAVSVWGSIANKDVIFKINPDDFSSGVVVCRFVLDGIISEMPKWTPIKNINGKKQDIPPLITSSSVTVNFSYNIVDHPLKKGDKVYYKDVISVGSTQWKIYLRKTKLSKVEYIDVYLEFYCNSGNSDQAFKGLKVKTTLISVKPNKNNTVEHEFSNANVFEERYVKEIHYYDLQDLLDQSKGFVVNNCITYEVTISYKPPKEESCPDCQIKICKSCLEKNTCQVCKKEKN